MRRKGLWFKGSKSTDYGLSNMSHGPLSMPLLVLRTTFPPRGGTKTLAVLPLASRRPLWGEMPKAEGAALADTVLYRM